MKTLNSRQLSLLRFVLSIVKVVENEYARHVLISIVCTASTVPQMDAIHNAPPEYALSHLLVLSASSPPLRILELLFAMLVTPVSVQVINQPQQEEQAGSSQLFSEWLKMLQQRVRGGGDNHNNSNHNRVRCAALSHITSSFYSSLAPIHQQSLLDMLCTLLLEVQQQQRPNSNNNNTNDDNENNTEITPSQKEEQNKSLEALRERTRTLLRELPLNATHVVKQLKRIVNADNNSNDDDSTTSTTTTPLSVTVLKRRKVETRYFVIIHRSYIDMI